MSDESLFKITKRVSVTWGRLRHFLERRPERVAPVMDARTLINNELPRKIEAVVRGKPIDEEITEPYEIHVFRYDWPGLYIIQDVIVYKSGKHRIYEVTISKHRRKTVLRPQETDVPWQFK